MKVWLKQYADALIPNLWWRHVRLKLCLLTITKEDRFDFACREIWTCFGKRDGYGSRLKEKTKMEAAQMFRRDPGLPVQIKGTTTPSLRYASETIDYGSTIKLWEYEISYSAVVEILYGIVQSSLKTQNQKNTPRLTERNYLYPYFDTT